MCRRVQVFPGEERSGQEQGSSPNGLEKDSPKEEGEEDILRSRTCKRITAQGKSIPYSCRKGMSRTVEGGSLVGGGSRAGSNSGREYEIDDR